MHYVTKSDTLNRVLKSFSQVITQTTKSPIVQGEAKGKIICEEITKVYINVSILFYSSKDIINEIYISIFNYLKKN